MTLQCKEYTKYFERCVQVLVQHVLQVENIFLREHVSFSKTVSKHFMHLLQQQDSSERDQVDVCSAKLSRTENVSYTVSWHFLEMGLDCMHRLVKYESHLIACHNNEGRCFVEAEQKQTFVVVNCLCGGYPPHVHFQSAVSEYDSFNFPMNILTWLAVLRETRHKNGLMGLEIYAGTIWAAWVLSSNQMGKWETITVLK